MKLPRFQFSLRLLLIGVTLFCVVGGWFGSQIRIVRQRKAWLEDHPNDSHLVFWIERRFIARNPDADPPLIRRWLGDTATESITVIGNDADAQAAMSLFPRSEHDLDHPFSRTRQAREQFAGRRTAVIGS